MILTATDLMLDDTGQPVPLASGEEALAGGLDCFLEEINPHSIEVGVSRMEDDIVNIHVGFKIANKDVSYQMNLELDGAEVKLVD